MSDEPYLHVQMLKQIDTESSVPRYRQISDQIAELILDIQPGARLPSEFELVSWLGISRATATQALRDLEQRGLVNRRQGKGTFVADTNRAIRSNRDARLPSFSEDLRKAGKATRERVIALEIMGAPVEVAHALAIEAEADVWRVERVIVSDEQPIVHLVSWLPCARFGALSRSAIEESSLYEQLDAVPGSPGRPCYADEQWSAALPPAATAGHLEVSKKDPVMRVVRTAYLHDDTPAEFVVSYVRGESFAVSLRIDVHDHTGPLLSHLSSVSSVSND